MTAFSADDLTQHADAMRRLARALLRDPGLADDAVQQACVTALTRPPVARVAVGAWLRAVVRSCALDLLRSEGRRRRREQVLGKDEPPGPGDAAERLELQEAIVAAVRALGEPYCTAVWLRYYEGQSPTEIARRLGEPVKTIKTRLWRALQLLRTRLDGRSGGRAAWLAAVAPLVRMPVGVTGLEAATAAGAGLMQGKKLVVAAAAVLVLLGGAVLWRSGAEGAVVEPAASSPVSVATDKANAVSAPGVEQAGPRENAATPVAASQPYGALVVQVRWHDAMPAPDVAVTFLAEAEPQLDRNETQVVSDAAGVARGEALHAGSVRLTSDRGGEISAEVVAGTVREVEFVLPRGVDVTGMVFDELRRPVPGARIVLASGRSGLFGGRTIARTGGNGAFAVRAVDPRWSLGAEAPGYAPSSLVDLERLEGAAGASSLRVELHLLHRGGGIAGLVVDESGHGIAGAVVAIGKCGTTHREGPFTRETWGSAVTVTGENGAFLCNGLAAGLLPIVARAPAYADASSEVACVVGTTAQVTLVMSRGVAVQGCVHDEQGAIVAGAVIRALADPNEDSIDSRRRAAAAFVRPPETRSDAAGCYRLQFVPPGAVHLLATGPATGVQFGGTCRETRSARAGEQIAWDPVLVAGKTIRVALVDEHGKPALGHPIGIAEQHTGRAEVPGSFPDRVSKAWVFKDCADVPYTVAVQVHFADETRRWIYQTGVRPGGPEVRLVVPARSPPAPPGSVSGGLADAGHRLDGRTVQLSLCSRGTRRDLELSQGRFRIDKVEPGRYFVWATTDEGPVAIGPWFEVHSGQHHEAGDLVTTPGGSVRITVRAPAGADLAGITAFLGESWNFRTMCPEGEHLTAQNVSPGRYGVRLRAKGWSAPPCEVEVRAGEEAQLTIALVPAIERQFEFRFPSPEQWTRCDFVLRDAGGTVVAQLPDYTAESIGPFACPWKGPLPMGQFTLEAMLDGKRTAWPVDLRDAATSGQVLRFSLRPR